MDNWLRVNAIWLELVEQHYKLCDICKDTKKRSVKHRLDTNNLLLTLAEMMVK